jgi:hypothetical protein
MAGTTKFAGRTPYSTAAAPSHKQATTNHTPKNTAPPLACARHASGSARRSRGGATGKRHSNETKKAMTPTAVTITNGSPEVSCSHRPTANSAIPKAAATHRHLPHDDRVGAVTAAERGWPASSAFCSVMTSSVPRDELGKPVGQRLGLLLLARGVRGLPAESVLRAGHRAGSWVAKMLSVWRGSSAHAAARSGRVPAVVHPPRDSAGAAAHLHAFTVQLTCRSLGSTWVRLCRLGSPDIEPLSRRNKRLRRSSTSGELT